MLAGLHLWMDTLPADCNLKLMDKRNGSLGVPKNRRGESRKLIYDWLFVIARIQ